MNKQAYEHTVGLVLSKEAGFLDNVGTALSETWGDVKSSWNSLTPEQRRKVYSTGATGIIGALLGGTLGGWKGALLGGAGGALGGYYGAKHLLPWWDRLAKHYEDVKNIERAVAEAEVDQAERKAPPTPEDKPYISPTYIYDPEDLTTDDDHAQAAVDYQYEKDRRRGHGDELREASTITP